MLQGVFARLGADFADFTVMPQEFMDGGATVVSLGRYQGRVTATGKPVDAQFVHVWRIEDGRIKGFQQFTDTAQFTEAVRQS